LAGLTGNVEVCNILVGANFSVSVGSLKFS
jgi:hypothetical protein